MLKPSEHTPRTSALLQQLLDKVFPQDRIATVLGGAEVAGAFSALPFDHLFFTGSTAVGRKVMAAAARNLTPVTLELGGKSPAIIAPAIRCRPLPADCRRQVPQRRPDLHRAGLCAAGPRPDRAVRREECGSTFRSAMPTWQQIRITAAFVNAGQYARLNSYLDQPGPPARTSSNWPMAMPVHASCADARA
jgi:hypothetical protein